MARDVASLGDPVVPNLRYDWSFQTYTREETHMEPESGPLEDNFPLQPGGFQVPCQVSWVYYSVKHITVPGSQLGRQRRRLEARHVRRAHQAGEEPSRDTGGCLGPRLVQREARVVSSKEEWN